MVLIVLRTLPIRSVPSLAVLGHTKKLPIVVFGVRLLVKLLQA